MLVSLDIGRLNRWNSERSISCNRKESLHTIFKKLQKDYGGLFSIKLGTSWVVVLNNIDVVKEALLRKQDQFSGRISAYTGEVKCFRKN